MTFSSECYNSLSPLSPTLGRLSQSDARESSGCLLSRMNTLRRSCRYPAPGSVVNSNLESPDISTGRSVAVSPPSSLWPKLLACSVTSTPSSPSPMLLPTMSGRMTPPLLVLDSSLDQRYSKSKCSLSPSTRKLIGNWFGCPPSPEISSLSLHSYALNLTVPFELLDQTTEKLIPWFGRAKCFGVLQVLEKVIEHGPKQDRMLMLSLQEASSGTVTNLKNMLYLMNFEEQLMLDISSPGSTATPSEWRLKAHQYLSIARSSGFVAT